MAAILGRKTPLRWQKCQRVGKKTLFWQDIRRCFGEKTILGKRRYFGRKTPLKWKQCIFVVENESRCIEEKRHIFGQKNAAILRSKAATLGGNSGIFPKIAALFYPKLRLFLPKLAAFFSSQNNGAFCQNCGVFLSKMAAIPSQNSSIFLPKMMATFPKIAENSCVFPTIACGFFLK